MSKRGTRASAASLSRNFARISFLIFRAIIVIIGILICKMVEHFFPLLVEDGRLTTTWFEKKTINPREKQLQHYST
jgi:hypothetical protein